MTRAISASRRAWLLRAGAAAAATRIGSGWAAVDDRPFPWRPVSIVQPFGPGNTLDIYARRFAAHLAAPLGQPVIVETRPGASGNIATAAVASAAPDGHTLLMHGVGITLQATIPGGTAPDPLVALAPVTRLAEEPMVVTVSPALGARSLAELVALARRKPGALAYGTSGIGGIQHMSVLIFAQRAGIDLLHVPFVNSSQITTSLLAGDVAIAFSFPAQIEGHLKSGRLIPLAVTSRQRSLKLPDVPTIEECGYTDYEMIAWTGILATAGTPAATIARLHGEFVNALHLADVQEMFATAGARSIGNTPAEFASEMRASMARWAPIMRTLYASANAPG